MYEYYFMLRNEGIRCLMTAAPLVYKHGGCGNALLINGSDAYKAAALMRRTGLNYQGAYRTKDGVLFEEAVL